MRNCKVCGKPKTLYGSELRCVECRRAAERARYAEGDRELQKKQRRDWYEANKDAQKARSKKWRLDNHVKTLVLSAKGRAKQFGVPFDLAADDITIPETCPVLGIPIYRGKGMKHAGSPSLDRMVPALGYVRGNVQVISFRANVIKSDATAAELEKVLAFVRKKE